MRQSRLMDAKKPCNYAIVEVTSLFTQSVATKQENERKINHFSYTFEKVISSSRYSNGLADAFAQHIHKTCIIRNDRQNIRLRSIHCNRLSRRSDYIGELFIGIFKLDVLIEIVLSGMKRGKAARLRKLPKI